VGNSVSRVGSAAQTKATKQVAGTMKLDLAQFRELEAFAQFSSDLDERTKAQLNRGTRVNSILRQGWDKPLKMEEQVVVIFAAVKGYLDPIAIDKIQVWEAQYLEYIKQSEADILQAIVKDQKITEETDKKLHEAVKNFNSMFAAN
jgi:F-type H+-transporting ATPase subunit alpha